MKCVIICPLYDGEEPELVKKSDGDMIIAADAGYDAAIKHGIKPDLVIGDFDSMPYSHVSHVDTLVLPVKKDDTDTLRCMKEGSARGYHEFVLAGAIGGRIDHTISNLQCGLRFAEKGDTVWLCDKQNLLTVLTPGKYEFPALSGRKISVLAFSPEVRGINLSGTEWELNDAVLTDTYPLGCSNEFAADSVRLSFTSGALIVAFSMDMSK